MTVAETINTRGWTAQVAVNGKTLKLQGTTKTFTALIDDIEPEPTQLDSHPEDDELKSVRILRSAITAASATIKLGDAFLDETNKLQFRITKIKDAHSQIVTFVCAVAEYD